MVQVQANINMRMNAILLRFISSPLVVRLYVNHRASAVLLIFSIYARIHDARL